eukprot:783610-Prymnesium_polylepis.1
MRQRTARLLGEEEVEQHESEKLVRVVEVRARVQPEQVAEGHGHPARVRQIVRHSLGTREARIRPALGHHSAIIRRRSLHRAAVVGPQGCKHQAAVVGPQGCNTKQRWWGGGRAAHAE